MTLSRNLAVGIALGCLAATLAAVLGGWIMFRFFLNAWVREQAGDVQGHVQVLRHLNAGNTADARELLESRLDDDLVALVPEDHEVLAEVEAEVQNALDAARQYRREFPRRSGRTGVDAMVRDVLDADLSGER